MSNGNLTGPLAAGAGITRAEAGARRGASLIGQIAWAIGDGARSPYNVLVNIFIFAAYFTTVVIPDPVRGQQIWGYVSSAGALVVAIGAPILGAIADAGGRRKPWLLACILIGLPSMSALWFAVPGMSHGLGWIMLAVVGGALFFEWSTVFTSAMLPGVAPPGRIGILSGLGFSLGNLAGILVFLFYLYAWEYNPHPLFGLDLQAHEPQRAVGLVASVWLIVFSLPLFVLTPDSPATSLPAPEAIRRGLGSLLQTFRQLGSYRNIAQYLVARLCFNEGFIVMMLFTSVVAAGVLHWTPGQLLTMGLINSVIATITGVCAGWLDQRIGAKAATMLFVAGCLIANVVVCSITPDSVLFVKLTAQAAAPTGGVFPTLPDKAFLITQNLIALFVTGGLATSRSLMAKLAPPTMLSEFFGLYAVSGNAVTFMGPLAIGLITGAFHNQRAGVAAGAAFLLAGLVLMIAVREQPSSGSHSHG